MKRFISIAITLILGLSTLSPVFAAGGLYGNLSGTVVATKTNAPIAGATVSVVSPSGSYTAKTDSRGYFNILSVAVDTYTVSVSATGYNTLNVPGVSVAGDQGTDLGKLALDTKELATIAHVSARSQSGAFQPNQTIDSYTVNGARMLQSTGNAASTNENNALLAVPGVTMTNAGAVSIRGGSLREVGYEYDGVPFVEPFLSSNASSGLMNGVGDIQVVEGAGDATTGGVGSGTINIVPQRGTYPGTGLFNIATGGPNFNHQLSFSYGLASKNGAVSDFVSYNGQRFSPYLGYHTTPINQYFNEYAGTYVTNDQFTNNFFYKFGRNHSQQLQVLYTNILSQTFSTGGDGGVFNCPNGGSPATFGSASCPNPYSLAYYPYDTISGAGLIGASGLTPSQYANLIYLVPGTPSSNTAVPGDQDAVVVSTRLLKFEYDNAINANTQLAVRYYNQASRTTADGSYSLPYFNNGVTNLGTTIGGQTVGGNVDLLHQFGEKVTVSLNAQYNVLDPLFDNQQAFYTPAGAGPVPFGGDGDIPSNSTSAFTNADFQTGGYLCQYFPQTATEIANGICGGREPSVGINYNKTQFQNWGYGIRFQFDPTDKLKFDIGVRNEGQNQHWNNYLDQYGQGPPNGINPFDVPNSFWTSATLHPTELQPRASVSYEINNDNALHFSYGRSAIFANSQTAGTPFALYGASPTLFTIPAKPGALCGSGKGTPFTGGLGSEGNMFACPSYGAELYWQFDQNFDSPDAGNTKPAVYSNYDLSFNHQFKNGYGLRITPFYKLGTNIPDNVELNSLAAGSFIFETTNQGFNRTTGVEVGLTTPTHQYGFTGFLTATYQNALTSTPPLSQAETTVPVVSPYSLALGNTYRAGYISPFDVRLGGTENFKNGFQIIPTISYNVGYPYSPGTLIADQIGVSSSGAPIYGEVPNVNFNAPVSGCGLCGPIGQYGTPPGLNNSTGATVSPYFYDPTYSGTQTNPNIAASRGNSATSSNGGILSGSQLNANVTLQWKKNGNTFGIQFFNFLGNAFDTTVPAINPYYQPVANGLSGPQTNYNTCAGAFGTTRGCYAQIPTDSYAFSNGSFLLSNGNFSGGSTIAPLAPMSFQVFYQRAL